ncbi:hypothetical protein [Chroococcidiopsis cubana]|nr:hypothetical protein [Chroococcidiopsis cubana]
MRASKKLKAKVGSEVNNGTKGLARLRYLVFTTLCCHRRTRSYTVGGL